jgi:hypothetical protein
LIHHPIKPRPDIAVRESEQLKAFARSVGGLPGVVRALIVDQLMHEAVDLDHYAARIVTEIVDETVDRALTAKVRALPVQCLQHAPQTFFSRCRRAPEALGAGDNTRAILLSDMIDRRPPGCEGRAPF